MPWLGKVGIEGAGAAGGLALGRRAPQGDRRRRCKELRPDVFIIELRYEDTLLRGTDGLTRHVTDAESGELLVGRRVEQAAQRLIDAANTAGGSHDITAVVARLAS